MLNTRVRPQGESCHEFSLEVGGGHLSPQKEKLREIENNKMVYVEDRRYSPEDGDCVLWLCVYITIIRISLVIPELGLTWWVITATVG